MANEETKVERVLRGVLPREINENERLFGVITRAVVALCKKVREGDADAVPTNWLDSLLTGPDAALGRPPYDTIDIERLLRAVKDRIRSGGKP